MTLTFLALMKLGWVLYVARSKESHWIIKRNVLDIVKQ